MGGLLLPRIPSDATPLVESGAGSAGTSQKFSREDHVHPAAAVTPSGLVLLSTVIANNSATVDFPTGISATYDDYTVIGDDVVPQNSVPLYMVASVDGGATFLTAAGSYTYGGGALTTAYSGVIDVTTATEYRATVTSAVTNTGAARMLMELGNLNSAINKKIVSDVNLANGLRVAVGGNIVTASAVNALRFYMSTGNIVSGTFRLYGKAKT